jgi:Zn-dependent peptidase ImmA (M78 family)
VTDRKQPMAEANRISSMLNMVLGANRFPVKVDEVALEYSRQCFADSPVDKVHGEDLDGLEGMLATNKARSKWLIVYNSAIRSEGRKRFTIAHEFGHYILHRRIQDRFECGGDDIETGDGNERDIEAEADKFASTLLMPLDDFRKQVDGQPVSFDLLGHCAERYGVSLTAAALRWTEIAEKRAVLVASRDDHLLWSKSNRRPSSPAPTSRRARTPSNCRRTLWRTATTSWMLAPKCNRRGRRSGFRANQRPCI